MKNSAIAIVGMAGRFPGARNVATFWQNLVNGVESIRAFSDAELLAAGATPGEIVQPDYVKHGAVLEDLDRFDAAFFGFSPKDAAIMDPQHRIFLECAWEALEDAGHAPSSFAGSIGVFAGSGMNSYMIHNLLTNSRLVESAGLFLIRQTGNDKDVLATRVSYELDLHGPSISVQTACSTSLVAVHLACQSVLNQECDMALAGGVTVEFPHARGYAYREGEILSRDGHCRAFDSESSGTVFSSGAGIVVLRRLEDALADHDTVHAVILGSAINNDGARKVGYLAPSVEGQAEVIAEALSVAGVTATDISYVETHGTGTKVGDPIEIRALTQAFRETSQRNGYCAVGSLKTNIGHLDTAAGVAGLIKTVLALRHRQIPPSLHFRKPNPLIDFAGSPFFVNSALKEWETVRGPRRAGVTSLGIGGTNAHLILEEPPPQPLRPPRSKPYQLLTLSARTPSALEQAGRNLAEHLREHADLGLEDVAYTCQMGRQAMAYRRTVVAANREEAPELLTAPNSNRVFAGQAMDPAPGVVFMFSGQGSQYVNMGHELYESEPVFRAQIDSCAERLMGDLGLDLRCLLYPATENIAAADEKLSCTRFTQPALFSIEYALAQWWIARGVSPAATIGHSVGEYVAACLAGVFSWDEGLHLCAVRGRLMAEMPPGSMLSVAAAAETLSLPGDLSLAAVNAPEQCVISGPTEAVQKFASDLEKRNVSCRRLHTSHAFHSAMMDPMLESFRLHLSGISLRQPAIPYLSNLTGSWITPSEATDPDYWIRHLRHTVRFSAGLGELFRETRTFLEVGPGQVLASLARQHHGRPKNAKVLSSMRHPQEQIPDTAFLLNTVGQLWIAGHSIDWKTLHGGEEPYRIQLPTYPFERQRYWMEPGRALLSAPPAEAARGSDKPDPEQRFHRRVWKNVSIPRPVSEERSTWLLLGDKIGLGEEIARQLNSVGSEVIGVTAAEKYKRVGSGRYTVRPGMREDFTELLRDIVRHEHPPNRIIHLWPYIAENEDRDLDQTLNESFYTLLVLAQAWMEHDLEGTRIFCVTNGLQSVAGEAIFEAARATLLGPVRVIPKEIPNITCRTIDLDRKTGDLRAAARAIISECSASGADSCVAYRQSQRWVESFEPLAFEQTASRPRLREKGVYLITGGLGGIGLRIAEHLARSVHARFVLTGRTPFPPPSEWRTVLADPGTGSDLRDKIGKLKGIEALGGEILVLSADVANSAQMREVLRIAQQRFGEIHGVIHAAGLIEDAPLQTKTRESVARVLKPKVQGTLVLQELLGRNKLDFFLLFSSVSSLAPPAGQVDYAAANAFLDAFTQSETGAPITAVNWGRWSDIGMAGQNDRSFPGRKLLQTSGETVYSINLSCAKNWLLSEHRLKNGRALVPGTGYLHLAAAALINGKFDSGVQFEDVNFLAPLTVGIDETREVRVRLRRESTGFHFSILATENGKDWMEYACGQIARNQQSVPADGNIEQMLARCTDWRVDFDEQHRTRQEQYFDFGPRWRNLQSVHIGKREGLAELQLGKNFVQDLETWPLHPSLLDMATGCSLYLLEGYENSQAVYLPLSYKKIRIYRRLSTRIYSHIRRHLPNSTEREIATFDLTLLDGRGRVLAEIEDFALRRMTNPVDVIAAALPAGAAAEEKFFSTLDAGFSSAEALKAFDQILSGDLPSNIVVAKGDLWKPAEAGPPPVVIAKADGDMETVLAAWWQELLGVDAVGADDDFFGLGGHSLVAVRLFAKIKKTYAVELNLAALFEARTIRQLAAMIRKSQKPLSTQAKTWSALVPIQPNGSRPPLFCVHALGTSLLFYRQLAAYLGTDQPFFALQSPLESRTQPRETSIEELASLYIAELRAFRPDGPYQLGGASLGGFIALEMCQQLYSQGKKPDALILFDTVIPESRHHVALQDQLSQHWHNLRTQGARYLQHGLQSKSGYYRFRLHRGALALECAYYRLVRRELPASLHYLQVEEAHKRALARYVVHSYPGKITLLRAADVPATVATRSESALGWDHFAEGGLEIHDVPGGHISMFEEPNVGTLAETLKSILGH